MEAAGLAIGVLGLLGAFKDALDVFDLIAESRHLGRDYEILDTKLAIQKALLLQWADRVKLLHQVDYDKRLDEPRTRDLITRTLACIRMLLSDASAVQQRYGLSVAADRNPNPTDVDEVIEVDGDNGGTVSRNASLARQITVTIVVAEKLVDASVHEDHF